MCSHKYTNNLAAYPIQVTLDGKRYAPAAFCWRGKAYHVSAIQELWRLVGAWWDEEGEKTFFRVLAETGAIFELSYDHASRIWLLERVED